MEVTIRKEIRDMTPEELDRFFNAVYKMAENKNGPGTSDFFRIAGYHGYPDGHCLHGLEAFPGWHRIFLFEFEKLLKQADRDLGNNPTDGGIFLPYWDWTVDTEGGLPQVVLDRYQSFPPDLFPPQRAGYQLRRNSNRDIGSRLVRFNVPQDASNCLLTTQHYLHASTGWENHHPNYASIEQPHNMVHVAVGGRGGAMSSVPFAAFDIAFWLHHCNVDRLYETYLKLEPDSQDEFEAFQAEQPIEHRDDSKEENFYQKPLEPFKKPDGTPYYPRDTFDIKALGYGYSSLMKSPGQALYEPPTVIVIPNISITEMQGKCWEINLFLMDKNTAQNWTAPTDLENLGGPNYCGGTGIFGRGPDCENCQTRPPFTLILDVTQKIRGLGLSRYEAVIRGIAYETTEIGDDRIFLLEDTNIPTPYLTGPLFDDRNTELNQTNQSTQSQEEVRALQKYLKKFGYYESEIDGSFGPVTETAVREYQQTAGIESDGLVGPITKEKITQKKRCNNKDPFASNTVQDIPSNDAKDYGKKNLTYFVGREPGYLKKQRDQVDRVIDESFTLWQNACGLSFSRVNTKENADILVAWANQNDDENLLRFDGPGGILGRGGKGFVYLDPLERWVIDTNSDPIDSTQWRRGTPQISLRYTVFHEIGHAIGLDHTNLANDVMGPYYNPSLTSLSGNDIARVQAIHGPP